MSKALLPASQSTAPGSAAASKIVLSTAQREADELKRSREEDDTIRERSEKRARGEDADGDASEDDMDISGDEDEDGQFKPSISSPRCDSVRDLKVEAYMGLGTRTAGSSSPRKMRGWGDRPVLSRRSSSSS